MRDNKMMWIQIAFIVLLTAFLTSCYILHETKVKSNNLEKLLRQETIRNNETIRNHDKLYNMYHTTLNEHIKQINELEQKVQTLEKELEKKIEENKQRDTELELFTRTIFRLETGNGTSQLWVLNNNPGGIKCGEDYCSYPTKEQGMDALRNLLKWYHKEFGTDYKAATDLYCQCGEDYYPLFNRIFEEEKEKLFRGE